MSLPPGTRIGPYEVVALLGEGGMGQVYRARDTKLGRDIALKVLPDSFLHDADRLARFHREAQVLASLNHPHIAAIYGFEDAPAAPGRPATSALVLELVEGPTLAECIASGPMAMADALTIASQIASALAAAHACGIVHRDLKPANVVLHDRGSSIAAHPLSGSRVSSDGAREVGGTTAKVLDFGLAKPLSAVGTTTPSGLTDAAQSPTMTSPAMTEKGLILGTAAYMAPEQARGRAVDRRADIWAFGCLLFEMLTGRRVFPGETVTDTLATILRSEPDWSLLPPGTPAPIRRLLRRCLVKDPAHRLADISDAELELADARAGTEPSDGAAPPVARSRSLVPWLSAAALAVLALVLGAVALTHWRESPAPSLAYRLGLLPPDGAVFSDVFGPSAAVSPDGRSVVYVAQPTTGGAPTLWVRHLAGADARQLAGTEEAVMPFWSPDSRAVAFFASSELKRVELAGGHVSRICSVPIIGGGVWLSDGTIVLGGSAGLSKVPATGGEPALLTKVTGDHQAHVLPSFLPDGRRFIFTAIPSFKVLLSSIDNPASFTEVATISNGAYYAHGHLFFVDEQRLMVQPFDADRGATSGPAVALADGVRGYVPPPAANTLIIETGAGTTAGLPVWVARDGRETGRVAGVASAQHPRLSPDGGRLALVIDTDVWVTDLRGRPPIRVTFDGKKLPKFSPLWTRDGRRLIFEDNGLWSVAADGTDGTPARVSPPTGHFHPHAMVDDGLIASQLDSEIPGDVVLLQSPTAPPKPLLNTPAVEGLGGVALSHDGRWLAYTANPTGRQEIWVRPYPGPGAPIRVSASGGTEPLWAPRGNELYYRDGQALVAVAVQISGGELQFGPPERIVENGYAAGSQPPSYDVAPDGRFLMLKLEGDRRTERPLTVIVNWMEEVRRLSGTQ